MCKRLFLILVIMLCVSTVPLHALSHGASSSLTDSLLTAYDSLVAMSDTYLQARQDRIDRLLQSSEDGACFLEVADLYMPYRSDSALKYYALAMLSDDEGVRLSAHIRRIRMLASIGDFTAGFAQAASLPTLPDTLLPAYYDAMQRLYAESAGQAKLAQYHNELQRKADRYNDSLRTYCEQHGMRTREYYRHCMIRVTAQRNFLLSLAFSDSTLMGLSDTVHTYAVYAFERAIVYREMGLNDAYMQWLIRSAMTDVRCGVADNGSSWMVASAMYDRRDLQRAYDYVNYSLKNTDIFNAKPRYQQVAPLAILINKSHEDVQRSFAVRLVIALLLLALVTMGIVAAVVTVHHRNKRLHRMNDELSRLNAQLSESNMVKEQYICRYLEVYSNMITRMGKMARKTEKDPDAFLKREMQVYYRDFDQTFVTLYPTFINDLNALLRAEERIQPKQGDIMTTELRIFALIRLGIDSSSKIAELLCYSPNTIYNYRAQVRNAAINKEQFEQQVRCIGRQW